MFTKIISQLSLSPTTVERLARHAVSTKHKQRLYGWAAIILGAVSVLYVIIMLLPAIDQSPAAPATSPTPYSSHEIVHSHTVTADHSSAGQAVTWRLSVQNTTGRQITDDIWIDTSDLQEYARVTNVSDSGISSPQQQRVDWPRLSLAPHETKQLNVTAVIESPVSNAPRHRDSPATFDCHISVLFGNTTSLPVTCPPVKHIEQLLYTLPSVSSLVGFGLFAGLSLFSLAAHLVLRLHNKEVRIIRSQINTGGIL